MITETPSLQKQVQPEGRFVNLIKQEFIKHAKEINKLEKDVDYKYYTKDEVDVAISEALSDLISSSADVIETLEDITETIDSKLDKGSPDYVKEVVVDGQNIVVTTGDNKTSIKQVQIPDVPTKTSDLINDSNYISKVYWGDIINKPTIPIVPKNVSAFNNDSGYITGVSWDEVLNKPNFAKVATSGSYSDLSNKPTIPTVPTKVSAFTNDAGYITGVAWNDITNKPSTFPPSTHNHDYLPLSGGTLKGNIYTTPYYDATIENPEGGQTLIVSKGHSIKGTPPSEDEWHTMVMAVDNTGSTNNLHKYGQVETAVRANGRIYSYLQTFKNEADSTATASIEVGYDANGNVYTAAPTPAVNSNTTHIATTAWVNTKLSGYSATSHNHNGRYPIINRTGMTLINSNTNLNTLRTAGTYYTSGGNGGSTVHESLSNSPTNGVGGGFMMYVVAQGSDSNVYPKQILYMYNGDIYERTATSTSAWGEWHKRAYTDSDITGNAATATTANALNNLYTVSTRPTSANKCYADGKLRVYLATSKMTTGKPPSDAQILHLAWDNSKYDSQIAVSTGSNGDLYWRTQKGSDTWGEWQTAAKSGHTHSYLPLSGGTLTGDLQLGTSTQSQFPTTGIAVHDTRSVNATPGAMDKGINFFFSNNTMPNTNWWAGMRVKGWTGAYSAWEIVGAAHNTNQSTLPLYVRTSNATTAWGSWRKIYDSSNKPTLSELGAAASSHSHSNATSSANGFMSKEDKSHLNKIGCTTYGSTSNTSKIKININNTGKWMLSFVVTLYQGYRATKVMVSGYQYGSSHWYSPTAVILGDTGNGSLKVYFGYDSVNNLWVGFDGGSYTGITIDSVVNGYEQISDFSDLFTISSVSALNTLQSTVTAKNPYYSSMSATEATTGTATTARVITAKVLHDKIKEIVNQAMTKNNLTKI